MRAIHDWNTVRYYDEPEYSPMEQYGPQYFPQQTAPTVPVAQPVTPAPAAPAIPAPGGTFTAPGGGFSWAATQNAETQTTNPGADNYNPRDRNIEVAAPNWYDYLQDQAGQFQQAQGWNPYDQSDLMGVIRNMSYATNQQPDTYWLNNVLQGWNQRNSNVPGGGPGGPGGEAGGTGAPGRAMSGLGYFSPSQFNAPTYRAPGAFNYPDWQPPTKDNFTADPGYDFRMKMVQKGLENAKSIDGLLASGEFATDLANLTGGMASQEFSNIHQRQFNDWRAGLDKATQAYERDFRGNLTDYTLGYQKEADEFARELASYGINLDAYNASQGRALDLYALSTRNLPTYTPLSLPNYSIPTD